MVTVVHRGQEGVGEDLDSAVAMAWKAFRELNAEAIAIESQEAILATREALAWGWYVAAPAGFEKELAWSAWGREKSALGRFRTEHGISYGPATEHEGGARILS